MGPKGEVSQLSLERLGSDGWQGTCVFIWIVPVTQGQAWEQSDPVTVTTTAAHLLSAHCVPDTLGALPMFTQASL